MTRLILSTRLVTHDGGDYPGGAVIGWVPPGDIETLDLHDPDEAAADPSPFDTVG